MLLCIPGCFQDGVILDTVEVMQFKALFFS